MYLADYHLHSAWSVDGREPMTAFAQAAAEKGLQELCFTDHVELTAASKGRFDWAAMEKEYQTVLEKTSCALVIRRGFELGEILRDPAYTKQVLSQLPKTDFLIGSVHKLSDRFGREEVKYLHDDGSIPEKLADYLKELHGLVEWGQFDVLGHLTLPLRYLQKQGCQVGFDAFREEMGQILSALIHNGKGIELNTNCGQGLFLPDETWLRFYRECGGEIITLGSDAHDARNTGAYIREGQALLKACGFRYFATYQNHEPIFHSL